jgi:hypothetical protein
MSVRNPTVRSPAATRDGWRYVVQAHVHVRDDGTAFAGHAFIPGYDSRQAQTPKWVVAAAPKYSLRRTRTAG